MVNVLDDGNSYLLVPRGRLVAPASSQIGCTGGKSLQLCTYWSGGSRGLKRPLLYGLFRASQSLLYEDLGKRNLVGQLLDQDLSDCFIITARMILRYILEQNTEEVVGDLY